MYIRNCFTSLFLQSINILSMPHLYIIKSFTTLFLQSINKMSMPYLHFRKSFKPLFLQSINRISMLYMNIRKSYHLLYHYFSKVLTLSMLHLYIRKLISITLLPLQSCFCALKIFNLSIISLLHQNINKLSTLQKCQLLLHKYFSRILLNF